jgi:hypothetical protein
VATSTIKVVYKGTLLSQEIRNIFYFLLDGTVGSTACHLAIGIYLDALYGALSSITTSALHFTDYDLYWWSTSQQPHKWIFDSGRAKVWSGGAGGDTLPLQAAYVILAKVVAWRGFGRKFFAGIPEAQQDLGTVVSGCLAALTTAALHYITPRVSGTDTITPGIIHYTSPSTLDFRPFISSTVSNLIGSMRRRKPGVGR